ncbi:MAG: hypothetical protein ACKVVT_00095 [Dehalococcoidia bacterium]
MDEPLLLRVLRERHPRAEALAILAVEELPGGATRVEAEWADTCEYVRRDFVFSPSPEGEVVGPGGARWTISEGGTRRSKPPLT